MEMLLDEPSPAIHLEREVDGQKDLAGPIFIEKV